jgi:hypothetical protein
MTLDRAFPARPVFLSAGRKPSILAPMMALAFCIGALVPALWTLGPGLIQDYAILTDLDPLQPRSAEGEVASIDDPFIKRTLHPSVAFTHKFQCTGIERVIRWCTAEIGHRVGLEWRRTEATYLFFDYNKSYVVGVVRAAGDPSKVTTAMGIEYYWSRVIMLLVLAGGLFAGAIGSVGGIANARRQRAQVAAARRLAVRPVIVEVRGVTDIKPQPQRKSRRQKAIKALAARVWYYTLPGATDDKPSSTVLPANNQPLFLSRAQGRTYALGAINKVMRAPVLLDQRLERLDLTDAEREKMWVWQSEFAAAYPAS